MPAARAFSTPGHDGVEVDRVHDDRIRLQLDHVLELVELQVGPVLGVERDHLVAHLAEYPLDRLLGLGLELVQQRRDHVVDGALVLGRRRLPCRQRQRRRAERERAAPRRSGHRPCLPCGSGCMPRLNGRPRSGSISFPVRRASPAAADRRTCATPDLLVTTFPGSDLMARPETERGTPAASGLLGECAKPTAQFHQARVSEPSRRQHLGHAGPRLPRSSA